MRTRKNYLPLNSILILTLDTLLICLWGEPTFIKDQNGCFVFNRNKIQTTNLIHFGYKKVMIKTKVYQSMKSKNDHRQ